MSPLACLYACMCKFVHLYISKWVHISMLACSSALCGYSCSHTVRAYTYALECKSMFRYIDACTHVWNRQGTNSKYKHLRSYVRLYSCKHAWDEKGAGSHEKKRRRAVLYIQPLGRHKQLDVGILTNNPRSFFHRTYIRTYAHTYIHTLTRACINMRSHLQGQR